MTLERIGVMSTRSARISCMHYQFVLSATYNCGCLKSHVTVKIYPFTKSTSSILQWSLCSDIVHIVYHILLCIFSVYILLFLNSPYIKIYQCTKYLLYWASGSDCFGLPCCPWIGACHRWHKRTCVSNIGNCCFLMLYYNFACRVHDTICSSLYLNVLV